jgi:hypothetical protein
MRHPVNREAAAIAFEQFQMREHAVGQFAIEALGGNEDLGPILQCAFRHRVEFGALAVMFGHGRLPVLYAAFSATGSRGSTSQPETACAITPTTISFCRCASGG